jgi:hypothetical protein
MTLEKYTWIYKFFGNNLFSTPILVEQEAVFYKDFHEKFDLILKTIEEINAPQKIQRITNEIVSMLYQIIDQYYRGAVVTSIKIAKDLIYRFYRNKYAISGINDSPTIKGFGCIFAKSEYEGIIKRKQEFFRARIDEIGTLFNAQQMLHIGFNSREKVNSQRFSIPGLPCLYFGTTSYGCWIEMGCPQENNFYVSCARFMKNYKILNLGINEEFFVDLLKADDKINTIYETIDELFAIWILSYATSFRITQKDMCFRSDYIIPQLIMLALKGRRISGVAYYSKQNASDKYAFPVCVNLALLADYNGEEVLSKMCNNIAIINPVNYGEFRQITSFYGSDISSLFIETYYGKYARIAGRDLPYRNTSFFKFDTYLCKLLKDQFT